MKQLLIIFVLILGACKQETAPILPPPVAETPKLNGSIWPNKAWQDYIYARVKDMPKASDEKSFCPQGMSPENWVHFFGAMAKRESNFKPALEYPEKFRNGKGEIVISTGLFQVSYESSRGYGFAGITTDDLKNPYKNIDVAIAIMRKWVGQDGVIGTYSGTAYRGGSRYWSVLRTQNDSLSKTKAILKPWCQ